MLETFYEDTSFNLKDVQQRAISAAKQERVADEHVPYDWHICILFYYTLQGNIPSVGESKDLKWEIRI